jgi:hypothetical protein
MFVRSILGAGALIGKAMCTRAIPTIAAATATCFLLGTTGCSDNSRRDQYNESAAAQNSSDATPPPPTGSSGTSPSNRSTTNTGGTTTSAPAKPTNPTTPPQTPQGWATNAEGMVFHFASHIRLGDDPNWNATHSDRFALSGASSATYSAAFTLPQAAPFSRAELRYEVAGAGLPNRILVNKTLAGTTCITGDSANSKKACPPIVVSNFLQTGNNTLVIQTVPYSDGRTRPLDDIEIFGLRLQLVK